MLRLFLSALLLPSPASGVVVGARAEWTHTLRTPPPHLSDRAFPAAAAKGGCEVVNSKTALLLIEYQNEFTTQGGKLHEAVKPVMDATQMLPKSAALANAARAAGVAAPRASATSADSAASCSRHAIWLATSSSLLALSFASSGAFSASVIPSGSFASRNTLNLVRDPFASVP